MAERISSRPRPSHNWGPWVESVGERVRIGVRADYGDLAKEWEGTRGAGGYEYTRLLLPSADITHVLQKGMYDVTAPEVFNAYVAFVMIYDAAGAAWIDDV